MWHVFREPYWLGSWNSELNLVKCIRRWWNTRLRNKPELARQVREIIGVNFIAMSRNGFLCIEILVFWFNFILQGSNIQALGQISTWRQLSDKPLNEKILVCWRTYTSPLKIQRVAVVGELGQYHICWCLGTVSWRVSSSYGITYVIQTNNCFGKGSNTTTRRHSSGKEL